MNLIASSGNSWGQPSNQESYWLICESQDRWYRAVCRFAPTILPLASLRIERISLEMTKGISGKVKSSRGQAIILWELATDAEEFFPRLDQVAALRCETPEALQIAWLSPNVPAEVYMAAQEAGISFFLENLGSLSRIGEAISRHFRNTSV